MTNAATATTTATTESPGSGISDAQKIKNLHTASDLVAAQLQLDRNNLTYEQRLKFDKALAVVITKYPERFTQQSVLNAQYSLQKNFTPLDDTGFNVSEFGTALVDNAIAVGNKVGQVGQAALDSVVNVSTVLKYALPIGAVLFLYLWIRSNSGRVAP